MSYYAIDTTNDLTHHGILGMKWGVRRYQNEDGSLTSAGRLRYYGAGGDRKGYYREKGSAKRYKDVLKYATKKAYNKAAHPLVTTVFSKDYRNWRKENENNRGAANYANAYKQKLISEAYGNNKRALADAKYSYEHQNLAKYVNRDGSLTTAGKLKYWDTNAARGQKRLQRDLNRDAKRGTTSEREMAKFKKNLKSGYNLRAGQAKITLGEAGLTALGSVGKAATGRPISAGLSGIRATNQFMRATNQKARANRNVLNKYNNTLQGQTLGINNQAAKETRYVNNYRAAKAADRAMWENAPGTGVKKYANYVAATNKSAINKITPKRKRKN